VISCSRCRSYAINYHLHGRDWDSSDADLCDVCYWRKRAEAALTPPEGSDQSLLELAATFETCIPFLPSVGQRNIGKAVAHLRHMAMGYVLVPVEPTEAMWDSGDVAGDWGFQHDGKSRFKNGNCGEIWAAMLAARPEVKP